MKTRHPLLLIAVALAACFWTSDAMTQAVTMPASQTEKSRPAVHAGIATHHTGERPSREELPGTAQPAAGVDLDAAAVLRQQALAAMETLREEIATLTALKHAQAALLAWNRGRTEAGEAPVFLAGTLCNERAIDAWCRLLPATFGTGERPGTPHTPSGGYTEVGHDRD